MPDFTLQPANTLVVGMTGAGKTTFVNTYLINAPGVACRFIFDDLNRMWPRLKLSPCYSLHQLESSLATRWSAYNPLRMYGGDTRTAFRWWCRWVFNCATRGPGKKLVVVPELWRHCTGDSIPQEFALLAQAGRELHVELVLDTQRPEAINPGITGQATELVCFRLMAHEALRAVERLWRDCGVECTRERIAALPLGSFIAWNRLSGGCLAGRVF